MKPAWDKLMGEFEGNAKIIVGDVDCTAAGKPLCDSNGVKGFPTIKHGDVTNLEDYSGGRDFAALKAFAEGLKPLCSPSNMDLCEPDQKAKIGELMALSDDDIAAQIEAGNKKLADAESTFSSELEKLQASYKQLQEDKEKAETEVKESGLGMLKAVQAAKKAGAGAKEEL